MLSKRVAASALLLLREVPGRRPPSQGERALAPASACRALRDLVWVEAHDNSRPAQTCGWKGEYFRAFQNIVGTFL